MIRDRLRRVSLAALLLVMTALIVSGLGYEVLQREKAVYDDLRWLREKLVNLNVVTLDLLHDTTAALQPAQWEQAFRIVGERIDSPRLATVPDSKRLARLHQRLGQRMARFLEKRRECAVHGKVGQTACTRLLERLATQVRLVLQDLFAETARMERQSTRRMDRRFYQGGVLLLILIAALAVITMALLLPTARRLDAGLGALVEAAQRFRAGRLDHRLPVGHDDELGHLATAFNEMAASRERAENELQLRERWLSRLLETIPFGVQESDLDGRIVYSNPAHHQILGLPPGTLPGKRVWDFAPDDAGRRWIQETFRNVVENQPEPEPLRMTARHTDGHELLLEVTWDYLRDADGRLTGFISVVTDVTDRVRAEEALRRSEANLAEAQKVARLGSWELDLVSGRLWWSEEIYHIFDIDPERFGASYEAFLERVHPDDREAVDQAYRRSVAERTPYEIVHRLLLDDGRVKYVHERGRTDYAEDGTPTRSIGTVQDVTEQQLAHRALQESERELDTIIENLPLMLFLKDAETLRFVRFNRAGSRLLGLSADQVLGRTDHDLFPAEQADAFRREDLQVLESGRVLDIALEPVDTRNGRRYLHTRKACIRGADGRPRYLLGISEDITERVEAENRVRYRLSLEAAMARISTDLAQAREDELDAALERALEEIGRAVGADRSTLFQIDATGDTFTNTHEWCGPGILPRKERLQGLPLSGFTGPFERFRRGEILNVSDPDALDGAFAGLARFMRDSGIRSLVNVPVLSEGELLGVVGFDAEQEGKQWPEEDVRLLRIVAEAVAGALTRKRAARAIREHTWYLEGLDRISRILAGNLEQHEMLDQVAAEVLDLFGADRAWLLKASGEGAGGGYEVPIEHTRPDFPGALEADLSFPDDEYGRTTMGRLLKAREPLVLQSDELPQVPDYLEAHQVRSQMMVAIRPRIGPPWILGVHQCERHRRWSPVERRLFQSIAERVAIALAGVRLMEEIRQSEQRLQEAEKIAQVGTWELDLTTGSAYWSDQEYRCLGYEPGACEPGYENFARAVHPDDLERVDEAVRKAIAGELEPYEIEHRVVWRDGSIHVVHELAEVIRNADGEAVRMIGTTQDVTQRVTMEQELKRHREQLEELVEERTRTIRRQAQIIEQTNDSVITTDLDGVVTSWNHGAVRVFGYGVEEALGRHIGFVYPEASGEFLEKEVIAPLKAKGTHEVEVQLKRKDGTLFPAFLSLSLLYDESGRPEGMVGYGVDISELKKREEELRLLAERLEASNRELESFSYSVSHDLRAPLRAIDGFSQALVEDYGDRLDGTALDYLSRIRRGAQRLGTLIDDLLQLSRVNRGELRREPVDLGQMAHSVMEELRAAEPHRKVALHLGTRMTAEGDPRLLRALVENLLGNAWKFTSKEEKAEIRFERLASDPRVFYVADNGVGFDMRHANKLFGAFQRLHRASEFPGSGIGLATVQRIVHRHGGRVWAEAESGRGATFYFTLDSGAGGAAGEGAREDEG